MNAVHHKIVCTQLCSQLSSYYTALDVHSDFQTANKSASDVKASTCVPEACGKCRLSCAFLQAL